MEPIYVIGHRNPDTDSIVAAMAYAELRNALGDREYVAARIGHLTDETQYLLKKFGFEPPVHIHSVRTQVRDLTFDTPPALSSAVTIQRGWEALQVDRSIPGIPVVNEDGTLCGMLSASGVAKYDIRTVDDPVVHDIPVFNLLSVLEGEILNSDCTLDAVSGQVTIALPRSRDNLVFSGRDNIVICGMQEDMIRRALAEKVQCLIVCQTELSPDIFSGVTDTCIVATPCDPFRAARLIYQAVSIAAISHVDHVEYFHLDDYVDDVRERVLQSRHKSYPVVDENEHPVGCLSRFHLLRPNRKRVVLVDHNETAQSVPYLSQAEILEIIDHHRLADIQTASPITVRNEPVGSTNTILAGMFQEKGLMPSEKLAGLMAAAIVADTVMFRSPTCTEKDRRMAERMARIAGISLDELGKEIFSSSVGEEKSADALLFTDYKEFHIAEHDFGISQITCAEADRLLNRKDEFLREMEKNMKEKGLEFQVLMLTDVLKVGTQILFLGDNEIFYQAFNVLPKEHTCFLPGVISRKKQIIPMLSALWG